MEKDQHVLSLDDVDEESQVIRPMDVLCGRGKVDHGRSLRFRRHLFHQNPLFIYFANHTSYFLLSDFAANCSLYACNGILGIFLLSTL
jgi:hypothetical protein